MKNHPKISVLVVTRNHEDFIAQAIESVLMQKTDFEYEIVVGEDCSTDKTREIVTALQELHSDRIRLLLNDRQLGMVRNRKQTFLNCRGAYVALLDGDDYWVDEFKLQKQASFLEMNANYSICFHDVHMVRENGKKALWSSDARDFSIGNLFVLDFIPTSSAMLRRINDLPGWYETLPLGDWPLLILHAQKGMIKRLDDIMGVYRIHPKGVSSTKTGKQWCRDIVEILTVFEREYQAGDPVLHRTIRPARRYWMARHSFLNKAYGRSFMQYVSAWRVVMNKACSKILGTHVGHAPGAPSRGRLASRNADRF